MKIKHSMVTAQTNVTGASLDELRARAEAHFTALFGSTPYAISGMAIQPTAGLDGQPSEWKAVVQCEAAAQDLPQTLPQLAESTSRWAGSRWRAPLKRSEDAEGYVAETFA